MSNLRNTKEFREALLAAYGVTEDKDVENKDNFKKAILDALGISYTTEDIKNFEKFRALLVSSADSLADNLIAENKAGFFNLLMFEFYIWFNVIEFIL